ncbi:hypothetical protein L209DRAFT_749991 [Thermothelomyces heterothallicus CBS 203.75]
MPSSTPMPPLPDMRPRFAPQPGPPPQLWSPPPDPEKPACPYRPGFAVEIKRHIPPPPFGDPHHGPGTWRERSDVDLYRVTQTRVVMEYPPLEHPHAPPSPPAPAAKLTILSALAVEDGRGPQLVVCSVAPYASSGPGPGQGGPPAPYEAVAKIFDPLYYSFENREAAHVPVPVAWQADVHYTHEAAALDHLAKRAQTGDGAGLLAPEYFGSWTFTLPITHAGRRRQRAVRLVLMENIKGPSIRAVCLAPSALASYTEQDRLAIFAAVLDGVARQRHAGVDQRDLAARNVVLRTGSPSPTTARNPTQPLPQPVIVDYNTAVVFELSRHGKHPSQLSALPQNPMELFWHTSFPDFLGWTPAAWDGNAEARQQWLKARFGGEAASQYAPVSGELEFSEY